MPIIIRIREFLRMDKVDITPDKELCNNVALFVNEIPTYHSDIEAGCFGAPVDHFPHYPVFGHY